MNSSLKRHIKTYHIFFILFFLLFFAGMAGYGLMERPLIHKVKRGETLWEIAIKYNVPLNRIIEANELKNINKLKINQTLVIPVHKIKMDSSQNSKSIERSGVYYRLKKGDTLWEISRKYKVSTDKIMAENNISSPQRLKVGEVLFIPMTVQELDRMSYLDQLKLQIRKQIALPGKVPMRRWQYIVIHHSATDMGNAKAFGNYHKNRRHMTNGLAYHFVITNGKSSPDGKLEIGGRWWKQLQGGHVKSDYYNNYGIGICLVGNFTRYLPTEKQFNTLVALVNVLQEMCSIPSNRVVGHGGIKREYTACPGKIFPMRRLKSNLKF